MPRLVESIKNRVRIHFPTGFLFRGIINSKSRRKGGTMTDAQDLEVAKRQLTKDILHDLNIDRNLVGKYSNLSEAEKLLDEYGNFYKQLYKYINQPYEIKK